MVNYSCKYDKAYECKASTCYVKTMASFTKFTETVFSSL